jgi:hypothetical protein
MSLRFRRASILAACAALLGLPAATAQSVRAATGAPPTFDARRTLALGAGVTDPRSLVVSDLDGDGRPDLVTGSAGGGTGAISVLRGTPAGSFAAPLGSPFGLGTAGGAGAVATGDLNGDGRPDVLATIVGTTHDDQLVPLAGDGTGKLLAGTPVTVHEQLAGLALADLDGDGDLDVLTASTTATTADQLGVLEQSSSGLALAGATGATATSLATAVVAGDLDGDGTADALVVSRNAGTGSAWVAGGSGLSLTAGTPVAVGADPVAVALADVDGDGDLDGLVLDGSAPLVTLLRNDGAGGLTATAVTVTGPGAGTGIAAGDLNGDGAPDLAITDGAGARAGVLLGDGAGGFADPSWATTGAGPRSPVIADLNGDTVPDLATADATANALTLLRATSAPVPHGALAGSFGAQPPGATGAPHTITITNTGSARLAITGVATAGADADDFLVSSDGCSGHHVRSGGADSCTVGVRFAPSAAGARSALLRVRTATGDLDVGLAGTGTAAEDEDDGGGDATTPTTTTTTAATTDAALAPAPAPAEPVVAPIVTTQPAAPKTTRLTLTLSFSKHTAKAGKAVKVGYALGRAAALVVRVKHAGQTVDIVRASRSGGHGSITWDGLLGRKAAHAGTYRLDVYAVAADGRAARASATLTIKR